MLKTIVTRKGDRKRVTRAAQKAACRAVEDGQIIRLSVKEQPRFVDAVLKPPALSPALKRAAKAYEKLIASAP